MIRRKKLENIPREQWDPKHPGPLAFQIRPTHVDSDLNRFEITKMTPKEITAWVILPTPAQVELGCNRCPKKHRKTNLECDGNKRKNKRPGKYKIYSLSTGGEIPGRWVVTSWEVPPGYKSGRAVLMRK